MTHNDLRIELRKLVEEQGKCAGIRAFALAHPDISAGAMISLNTGLSPSTIRIQVVQARVGNTKNTAAKFAARRGFHVPAAMKGSNVRQACLDEIERCKKIALEKWGVQPQPRVVWKKRGTTAGTAMGISEINLNAEMAEAEGDKFVKRTPGHEYAHCVVAALRQQRTVSAISASNAMLLNRMFGRARGESEWSSHGGKWKAVMRSFGLEPSRCHSYASADQLRRGTRRTCQGQCSCRVHNITPRMHARILLGARVRCKLCRTNLVAVEGAK